LQSQPRIAPVDPHALMRLQLRSALAPLLLIALATGARSLIQIVSVCRAGGARGATGGATGGAAGRVKIRSIRCCRRLRRPSHLLHCC
jgi:hypothetical protein